MERTIKWLISILKDDRSQWEPHITLFEFNPKSCKFEIKNRGKDNTTKPEILKRSCFNNGK